MQKKYYAYILKCSDGTFYCGYTTDLKAREQAHNNGVGAKYTRPRRPVVMAYAEDFDNKSDALKREWALKKLSHKQKQELVNKGLFE